MNQSIKKMNLHDLEKDIFSVFLQNTGIWIMFSKHIKEEFFTKKNDAFLFKIFKTYWDKHKHLPTKNQCLTFLKKAEGLKNSKITTQDIINVEKIYDKPRLQDHEIDHIKKELKTFIKRNKLEKAIYNAAATIEDEQKYYEIESEIKEAILWVEDVDLGVSVFEDVDKRYDELNRIYENVIKTPWLSLNAALGGGLFQKEISCIIAPSGVGKSIALSNIATHVFLKLKKNVVYISLELSQARLGQRIDVSVTRLKMGEIRNKRDIVKQTWQKLTKDNPSSFIMKEFPTSSVNSKDLENYLYTLKLYKDFNPDLIIVDYADILLPNQADTSGGTYISGGRVVEQLRGLGYIYSCPILTATQSNRSGYNIEIEEFNESHIGESMKKLFTLDTLIVLNSTDGQRLVNQGDMKVLKCRNGAKNSIIPFNIEYEYFNIIEQ